MEDVLNLDTKRDMNYWMKSEPHLWQMHDVLDFVFHLAKERVDDMRSFRGEYFRFDGPTLCNMRREQLVALGGEFGDTLYTEVQKLISSWDSSVSENSTWKCKSPEKWTSKEVLDWLFFGVSLCDGDVDLTKFRAEKFNVPGSLLCQLSCAEFVERDVKYGQQLHQMLKHLLQESTFEPPDSTSCDLEEIKFEELSAIESQLYDSKPDEEIFKTLDRRLFHGNDPSLALPYPPQHIPSPVETFSLGGQLSLAEKRPYQQTDYYASNLIQLQTLTPFQQVPVVKRFKPDQTSSALIQPGSEVCPPVCDSSSSKIKAGSKTRLWKFMWDLLQNPAYNPEYIRWESKKDGIFRIVSGRSKTIAELWGKIKNNPRMTFDKLGRSLRWCRANNGLFSAIPKNGIYPKKLCFRFMTNQLQELQRTDS